MSASALKSTMQGVGTSPPTSGHSILPMNVVAQKVVPGTESSASMKPLNNSGMSYTMLQPPNQQPLSLVQDHRTQVYQNQNQSYGNNNTTTTTTTTVTATTTTTTTTTLTTPTSTTQAVTTTGATTITTTISTTSGVTDKDAGEKTITNGVDTTIIDTSELIGQTKQNQDNSNRNNNLSPENKSVEIQQDCQKQNDNCSTITDSSVSLQITKVEETIKTPVNNGSKETESPQAVVLPSTTSLTITPVKINQQNDDKKINSDSPQKLPQTPTTITTTTTPITSPIVKQDNDNCQVTTKVEQKIATTPRSTQKRKSRETKDLKTGSDGGKPKRTRVQTQPYQSPLPEIALIVKETMKKTTTTNKNPDDKLIVFYKNEFLAVRNSEGSFYVCQAMQNIYKSSRRIRIRWLSQDKNNGEIYSPDFYDFTDFDCILTNLNLNKIDKNKYQLTKIELLRTENILKRAIDVEAGVSEKPSVTEEHPDGLDLSLFKDESQLKRRKRGKGKEDSSSKSPKRLGKRSKQDDSSSSSEDDDDDDDDDDETSSSSEEDEKKTSPKSNRTKRSTNKELALAKSLVKVPSRANRALLRGTRTNPTVEDDTNTNTNKKQDTDKKVTEKPTTSAASPSTKTKLRGSAQANEPEKTNDNSTTGRAKRAATTTGVTSTKKK